MIVPWTVYASAVAGVLALTARAVELSLRPRGWPVRWAWLAAMALSVAVPAARLVGPDPAPEPSAAMVVAPPIATAPVVVAAGAGGGEPRGSSGVGAGSTASAGAPPEAAAPRASLLARLEAVAPVLWLGASGTLAALLLLAWAMLLHRARGWRRGVVEGEPVLLSADTGPAVIGVLRGSIVLPEWVLAMEARERRLILRHERAHITARDPLLVAAGMAAVVLAPWNLPLWWQLRRLRLAIETDCDARVLGDRQDLRRYARLLLALGERAVGALPPGSPAFSEPRSFLERRIDAMIAPRRSRPRALAAGLLAVALAPFWVYAIPSPPPLRAAAPVPDSLPRAVAIARETPPVAVPVTGDTAVTAQAAVDTVQARFEPVEVTTLAEREYPADMRALGVEGTVTLRFTIDAGGRARGPEAISQSGLEFVEPAKRVVQELRFQPASYAGRPVEQAVSWFQVRFRLRPPPPSPRAEPRNEEVLLRAAIERYFPDLLRQEPARTPWVYFVVDERGNVVRRALDWRGPADSDPSKAVRARFPDLPGGADALTFALPTPVRTGIPGGRDIHVQWAVLRDGTPPARAGSWGPFPLGAVATPLVSPEVVRQAVSERYPELLQRASGESFWFLGYPDGEVLESGRTAQRGAPSSAWMRAGADARSIVTFQKAADGGVTDVLWIVPDRVAPGDPNVVSGAVRDPAGNPVAGAVVLLRDRPLGAATGADGRYAFRAAGLPAGSYTLLARHPSGAPLATREVALRPGGSVTADFTLPGR